MADIGWARSRGDRAEGQGLRRGAWYRVVEDEKKDYVVLDVHHVEVRMGRGDLEIKKEPPKAWSVVREPHLVCPGCHARYVVAEGAKDAKCPECGRTHPIDWKDAG
jgi:rubrerythrin